MNDKCTGTWLSNSTSISKRDITCQSNKDEEFETVETQIEASCHHLDLEPSLGSTKEVNNPRLDRMPDVPDVLVGLEQEEELQTDVDSSDANSKGCSSKKHAIVTAFAVAIIVLSAIIIIWLVMDRSCEAKPDKHPIDLEVEFDHHHLRRRLRCKS
eukprot:822633_1